MSVEVVLNGRLLVRLLNENTSLVPVMDRAVNLLGGEKIVAMLADIEILILRGDPIIFKTESGRFVRRSHGAIFLKMLKTVGESDAIFRRHSHPRNRIEAVQAKMNNLHLPTPQHNN